MKLRYWSKTCAILSEVPAAAICAAKSSSRGLGMEERKLMYAGEYKPRERSLVMVWRLAGVGSSRYKTGTSGIGCRVVAICLILLAGYNCWRCRHSRSAYWWGTNMCIVTPQARKSLTRSTLLITSRPRSSNTNIFHIGSPSELRIGVEEIMPLLVFVSISLSEVSSGSWLRFKIFLIESAATWVR